MKKFSILILTTLILIAGIPFHPWASAHTQDFTLINESGFDLYELYVSSTFSDDWEEDILADDILMDGDQITVTIDEEGVTLYDILIVDNIGNEFYWEEFNLDEISTIRIYCQDDEIWAEWN